MSLWEQGRRVRGLHPKTPREYTGEPGIAPGQTGDKVGPLALLMALAFSPSFTTPYRRHGWPVPKPPEPRHWLSSDDPQNQQKCLSAGCPLPPYKISLSTNFPQSQDSSVSHLLLSHNLINAVVNGGVGGGKQHAEGGIFILTLFIEIDIHSLSTQRHQPRCSEMAVKDSTAEGDTPRTARGTGDVRQHLNRTLLHTCASEDAETGHELPLAQSV